MAKLLDQYGNPIDTTRLREEQGGPSVIGMRPLYGEHPITGLTPARLGQILRSAIEGDPALYLELAEDMEERDPHYRGVIAKRKTAVSQLPISVVAASDEAEDQRAADLLRDFIARPTLEDDLFDLLDGIGKGFAAAEILWDTSGSQWMPRAIEWRDPRWFRFDPADGRTLQIIGDAGVPEPLAPYKWIVHIPKSKSGLPIRGGLARICCWYILFKSMDIAGWVEFARAYGHPVRLGKYGPGASKEDKSTLLRALQSIGQDFAAAIPQSMMIEFIESKLTGNVDLFERLADWIDRQVSKAVLGGTAGTDAISGGHSVGKEHRDVEADIERSDARQLANCLNQYLVRPLIDLNLGQARRYPRIVIERPDTEDIKGLIANLGEMVDRGMAVEQSVVRDKLGLEDPAPGASLLHPKGAGSPARGATPAWGAAPAGMETARQLLTLITGSQLPASGTHPTPGDALDELAAAELADWQPMLNPVLEEVRALLDRSPDLDSFLEALPSLAAALPMEALTGALARSLFAARLAGALDVPGTGGADA